MSFDTGNSEISAEMEFLKYPTQLPKRRRKLYHWGNPYWICLLEYWYKEGQIKNNEALDMFICELHNYFSVLITLEIVT